MSTFSGFHLLSQQERIDILREYLAKEGEIELGGEVFGTLDRSDADRITENSVGVLGVPLGVVPNLCVNGKDYVVPLATEESSVIAAASKGAKILRAAGGIQCDILSWTVPGEVVVHGVGDVESAQRAVLAAEADLVAAADASCVSLVKRGGGVRRLSVEGLAELGGSASAAAGTGAVIVRIEVDTCDAMGANAVIAMCETIMPLAVQAVRGSAAAPPAAASNARCEGLLGVVSNMSHSRLVRAEAFVRFSELPGGRDAARRIAAASRLARADPFRAVTHNKGIMNGVSAFALATGNDTRALEAGAHSYASVLGARESVSGDPPRQCCYAPLSSFVMNHEGLRCSLELPAALAATGGVVGGYPQYRHALRILRLGAARRAQEMACVMAGLGLAQNLAAVLALVTTGIRTPHMKLHAHNVAARVAEGDAEAQRIASQMIQEGTVTFTRAQQLAAAGAGNAQDSGEQMP